MYIRNYSENDLSAIEKIDPFCAISIRYHGAIHPENVRCVVDSEDEVIAVGYLKIEDGESQIENRRIDLSVFVTEEAVKESSTKEVLVEGLIERFNQIKAGASESNLTLRVFCMSDDHQDVKFYQSKGFTLNEDIPIMKYDLAQETKHVPTPDDIQIVDYPLTEENIHRYIEAQSIGNPDAQGEAELRFSSGDPSFKCFAAICNKKLIGAISIWNITEDRAATENLFVIESFRHKNIARALLATAVDELKERGAKIATLSLRCTNLSAMNLYQSIGYTFFDHLTEMIYT